MRLAEKLADHIIFLDRARVIFSGTVAEMERSSEPVVRNFLELDRFDMRALLSRKEPDYRIVA
jgi:phospholipid/cholesterol/gamma-HCH transport system ATP-binding protein